MTVQLDEPVVVLDDNFPKNKKIYLIRFCKSVYFKELKLGNFMKKKNPYTKIQP